MTRDRLGPAEQSAVREFVDAVLALSDDSGPANLERYLAVSRALDESRRPRESPAQVALAPESRARARGRGRRPARVEAARADA
jgi:hypothetical protein